MFDELAMAVYAAETGTHVIKRPVGNRWDLFYSRFDGDEYVRTLTAGGNRFVGRNGPSYPALLRATHDPPVGLFVKGHDDVDLAELVKVSVAIVGARACSGYGSTVARKFGRELAAAGITVVSGLARGIDAEAHRGALDAGGKTIAVLGCGIDRMYPASHAELARRIVESGGLIVSEYAPGVDPAPWRFPARNRIVAGMTAGTLVVEAREMSGALITCDLAMEEGREVWAIPGEIMSVLSTGCNDLIKVGATCVTEPRQILYAYGLDAGNVTEELLA